MIKHLLKSCFFGVLITLAVGCGSLLPKSAPPVYYQLDYQPPPVSCRERFDKAVRVMQFLASSPYGRTEMVVLQPQGKVASSSGFQWVSSPGTLVSENLLRDLTQSHLFPQVVSANQPANVPLELSGHVFIFAWDRSSGFSRAVLKVEVSLVGTEKVRQVLFHRGYDLQSEPVTENTSAAFAGAMGEVMKSFSGKLQQDLCGVLKNKEAERHRLNQLKEECIFENKNKNE